MSSCIFFICVLFIKIAGSTYITSVLVTKILAPWPYWMKCLSIKLDILSKSENSVELKGYSKDMAILKIDIFLTIC